MRQQLSRSNYVFSGLKTFHELNEAFPSLLDENGNRKTFERFVKDVQKIHETYNRNYPVQKNNTAPGPSPPSGVIPCQSAGACARSVPRDAADPAGSTAHRAAEPIRSRPSLPAAGQNERTPEYGKSGVLGLKIKTGIKRVSDG